MAGGMTGDWEGGILLPSPSRSTSDLLSAALHHSPFQPLRQKPRGELPWKLWSSI